jgi:hypothetical protein
MSRIGKYPRGEDHPGAKLSQADAETILKSALGASVLASRFGVCDSYVRAIRRGNRWRCLQEGLSGPSEGGCSEIL